MELTIDNFTYSIGKNRDIKLEMVYIILNVVSVVNTNQ